MIKLGEASRQLEIPLGTSRHSLETTVVSSAFIFALIDMVTSRSGAAGVCTSALESNFTKRGYMWLNEVTLIEKRHVLQKNKKKAMKVALVFSVS